MVLATQFDGFMPTWNHASCILAKAKQIKKVNDVEDLELLRWEDQQTIREYIDGAVQSNSTENLSVALQCGVEVPQTSSATCRSCSQTITKGEELAISEENASSSKKPSGSNTEDLENQLEMQSKPLWAIKDDLKKHVTTSELREMLGANEQDSRGSELDLRERW